MNFIKKIFRKRNDDMAAWDTVQRYRSDMQSAKKKGEKMIEKKPENPYGYYEFARYLQFEKRFPEAIENLNKSISLQPDFIAAKELRAGIYRDMSEYSKAIVDAEEVLQSNPNNYNITYLLGRSYYRLYMLKDALECFEKCAEIEPSTVNHRSQIENIKELMQHEGIRPLDLYVYEDVFNDSDINLIKEALKFAPIITEKNIIERFSKGYKKSLEGSIELVIEQLAKTMRENKEKIGISSISAVWVNYEFINVVIRLKYSDTLENLDLYNLLARKGDILFCIFE